MVYDLMDHTTGLGHLCLYLAGTSLGSAEGLQLIMVSTDWNGQRAILSVKGPQPQLHRTMRIHSIFLLWPRAHKAPADEKAQACVSSPCCQGCSRFLFHLALKATSKPEK